LVILRTVLRYRTACDDIVYTVQAEWTRT